MAGPSAIPLSSDPSALDLATQLAPLEQRRAMLASLLTNSMQAQPTQMLGQIAVRPPILGVLAKALTGGIASKGMGDVTGQERGLVQQRMANASSAMDALMNASQPQGGTPTTLTEEPGPPDANGVGSYSVAPGTPPTMDAQGFGRAYQQARFAGVDPNILNASLGQFQLGRLLMQMGYGNMVPGMPQGGAPTVTPGNAYHGASVSLPTGTPAAPQGAGAGGEGGFGGIPSQAVAMLMAGAYNPALGKIGEAMVANAKPFSGRPGAPVWGRDANGNMIMLGFSPRTAEGQTVDPQGNISTTPGYVSSLTGIETAKGAAQAPFQRPVDMPVSTGGTTPVPFNKFIGGGAPPPAQGTPAPGQGIPPQALAGLSPAQLTYLAQQPPQARAAYLEAALAQQRNPGTASTFTVGAGGTAVPGYTPQTPQSAGAGAPAYGPQSTIAKSEATGVGENYAKQQEQVDTNAAAATQGRATVAQMVDALKGFDPNAAAPLRMDLAAAAQAMGAPDAMVKGIAGGDLNAMQEFGKLAYGNSISQLRAFMGSGQRLTQTELLGNYANSPNPALQRAAITTMLQMQDGAYRWAQDKQQAKDAWVAPTSQGGHGTYAGFEGWWNRNRPLTGNDPSGHPYIPTLAQVKAQMAAAQAAAAPAGAPGEVPQPMPSPPPAAVQLLRAHPELRSAFEAKYGVPAASVLGQ